MAEFRETASGRRRRRPWTRPRHRRVPLLDAGSCVGPGTEHHPQRACFSLPVVVEAIPPLGGEASFLARALRAAGAGESSVLRAWRRIRRPASGVRKSAAAQARFTLARSSASLIGGCVHPTLAAKASSSGGVM